MSEFRVALAITQVAAQKNKVFIGSGLPRPTDRSEVQRQHVQWTYETWMRGKPVPQAIVKTAAIPVLLTRLCVRPRVERGHLGGRRSQRRQGARKVRQPDQPVTDSRHPAPGPNIEAKVTVCQCGGDTINAIKQAAEFGIVKAGRTSGLLISPATCGVGLPTRKGWCHETFYWT